MAKEASATAMSEDSIGQLEDVKKGKPRKFAMICKGTSIVSLVVYKKGNVEARKKEAKEAGKGQFYFGVVDGKGVAIRFALARADGFESEPVKSIVLKNYLDESAEIKCKPFFEIVDTSPLVLDEDDPLVARFLQLQAAAGAACDAHADRAAEINSLCSQIGGHLDQEQPDEATAMLESLEKLLAGLTPAQTTSSAVPVAEARTSPAPRANDAAAQFLTRLKVLKPSIDAAMAAAGANPEIKLRFSEAAVFARQKDFPQADALLDVVEQLLKQSTVSPPATSSGTHPADAFKARLTALIPQIKAAAGTPAGDVAKLNVSEAGVCARKQDFVQANLLLDQAEAALKTSPQTSPRNPADLFKERLAALVPQIKQAASTPAGDAAKLKASEAGLFARKSDFVLANALLDEAEAALKGSAVATSPSTQSFNAPTDASPGIAPGLVAKRKFLIERWKRIPPEISADLKRLQQAIERDIPDEDADLLIELSEDYLNDFFDDMKEAIDDDINSGDAQYKNAIKTIGDFRTKIASEPLIQHLKANTLKAEVTVESILLGALDEIEQALAN